MSTSTGLRLGVFRVSKISCFHQLVNGQLVELEGCASPDTPSVPVFICTPHMERRHPPSLLEESGWPVDHSRLWLRRNLIFCSSQGTHITFMRSLGLCVFQTPRLTPKPGRQTFGPGTLQSEWGTEGEREGRSPFLLLHNKGSEPPALRFGETEHVA